MNALKFRRSIRKYTDEIVTKDELESILHDAMLAPTAGNQQAFEFLVVNEKQLLKELSMCHQYSKFVENASAAILVIGLKETKYPQYLEQDLGAVTQNILLSAADKGIGSTWIGISPEKDRMKYLKDLFQLADNKYFYNIITLGYPLNKNDFKTVDRFDKSKIFWNKI